MMPRGIIYKNIHWMLFAVCLTWLCFNGLSLAKGNIIASYNLFFGLLSLPLIAITAAASILKEPKMLQSNIWTLAGFCMLAVMFLTGVRDQVSIFSVYQALLICSGVLAWAVAATADTNTFEKINSCAIVVLFTSLSLPVVYTLFPSFFEGRNLVGDIPGFGNVRIYGQAAAISGFAAVAGIYRSEGRLMPFLLFTLSCYVILWSGTRSALVGLIFASFTALAVNLNFKTKLKNQITAFTAVITAVLVASVMSSITPLPAGEYGVFERTKQSLSENGDYSSNRFEIWSALGRATLEKPAIGWGYLMLEELDHPDVSVGEAHNYIIDFIFGWGYPTGLVLAGLLWGSFLLAFIRGFSVPSQELLVPLCVSAGLLATGLFGGVLTTTFSRIILFVALGTALAMSGQVRGEQKQDRP